MLPSASITHDIVVIKGLSARCIGCDLLPRCHTTAKIPTLTLNHLRWLVNVCALMTSSAASHWPVSAKGVATQQSLFRWVIKFSSIAKICHSYDITQSLIALNGNMHGRNTYRRCFWVSAWMSPKFGIIRACARGDASTASAEALNRQWQISKCANASAP
jgi:hypothetical protein